MHAFYFNAMRRGQLAIVFHIVLFSFSYLCLNILSFVFEVISKYTSLFVSSCYYLMELLYTCDTSLYATGIEQTHFPPGDGSHMILIYPWDSMFSFTTSMNLLCDLPLLSFPSPYSASFVQYIHHPSSTHVQTTSALLL